MSVQIPVVPQIPKFSDPNFPHLVFEYHPATGKVYAVEIPGSWSEGKFTPSLTAVTANASVIAEHADTHGRAYGFVQTYLRGVRRGRKEPHCG